MKMGKTHKNVFPGANCKEDLRLLSETFLRVNSHSATFFMEFTQCFSSKIRNRKI